ncbi:hypothetical protein DFJ63DRAFT_311294 [Scheffersomyces coipomensis]|uniref:uncharacterized protein n=1 Tax=Scheffersomyces coipomensis TaxID=1788519 RepID=UPI00315C9D60
MDSAIKFLSKHFPLLPNNVITEIIQLCDSKSIERLMNIDVFEPELSSDLVRHIEIYNPNKYDVNMTRESIPNKLPRFVLSRLPSSFKPESVHIIGRINYIHEFVVTNSEFFKDIKDIRISVEIEVNEEVEENKKEVFSAPLDYRYDPEETDDKRDIRQQIATVPKLIQFPNLSMFEFEFYSSSSDSTLHVQFKVERNTDLHSLLQFSEKMYQFKNFSSIIKKLPISTDSISADNINFMNYKRIHGLKSLHLSGVSVNNLNYLPNCLENLTIKNCHFESFSGPVSWPTNMKSIEITNSVNGAVLELYQIGRNLYNL